MRLVYLLCVVVIIGACSTAPEATPQGPIVPTRQPTATPPPSPTPDPTVPDVARQTVFPLTVGGVLALDEPYEGEITGVDYAELLRFEGQAGQTVDITMDSDDGTLDTFLILRAPDGREIARNDDRRGGVSTDAALYRVDLPESGTYNLIATRFRQRFGETTGTFTLEISSSSADFDATEPTRLMSYGIAQTGTLDDENDIAFYTFEGRRGDVVTVALDALDGDLDPTLMLTDAAGNIIASNTDINILTNLNAAVRDFPLPYSGYYTVIATRFEGTPTSGRYELTIERTDTLSPGVVASQAYGVLDVDTSATMYDEEAGFMIDGFFVGDAPDSDTGTDMRVQTILTYYLPPRRNAQPVQAVLALQACDEAGRGFNVAGAVDVYADAIDTLTTGPQPFEPPEGAVLIESLDTCREVDVSEVVTAAYADERPYVQFRLLPHGAALDNDQTDAVVFTDPRLVITHGE